MDGTLVDTIDDLADSVNEMLAHFNLPQHSTEILQSYFGEGARKMLERALPIEKISDTVFFENALEIYNQCYAKNITNKTKPYAGIMDLLTELQNKKIPLGICTNKQNFAAQIIAEKILSPIKFKKVFGDEKNKPRKPNPARALEIAASFGVKNFEVAYFGDTTIDMQTALNAGFLPIGVTWGFRSVEELKLSGAEIIINYPTEIFNFVEFI